MSAAGGAESEPAVETPEAAVEMPAAAAEESAEGISAAPAETPAAPASAEGAATPKAANDLPPDSPEKDAVSPQVADASPQKEKADEAAKPGAKRASQEAKPGARRVSKEGAPAGAWRASREQPTDAEAEAVELNQVTAVQVANDGKMSKEMLQLVKDLDKKQSWVVRAHALRKLQGLVLGGAIGQFPAFLKAIKSSEFAAVTKDIFADLRSQLVKEMSDTVLALLKGVLDASVVKEYDQFFTDTVLVEAFRTVCKANSAIVSSADTCLRGMAKDFHSLRMLHGVVEPMGDAKANSRLRLQCAQLLTIILESWAPEKLSKGMLDVANKRVHALEAIEHGILKCLSDNKSETRLAAKGCHDKYVELFPQRVPQLLERMNRQQQRVVREDEPEAKGDDKEGGAHKRKPRIFSISPERKPAPTQHPVSEAERLERKRHRDLAERARAHGSVKGDGKEADPAEALVLVQGELAEAKDKLEELEKQLTEEKRKSKNLQKIKDEDVKNREPEHAALEKVLGAAEADGESEAGNVAKNTELEEKMKQLQQRLKKEQARARKMTEERNDWQRKCKAAELEAWKLAKGAGKEGDDKNEKRVKRVQSTDGGKEEQSGEGKEKGKKKSKREEKEEVAAAELAKQLEEKNKKAILKLKKVQEEFGLLEEEKKILEEKLAEFESQTQRARAEFDVKGGELRQVKERWQVREKDWFEARMFLEREVETLKAELQRANGKAQRWGEERQQLLKRVQNFRVRLGEEEEGSEDVKEYDAYSASNLARRKLERQREAEEELSEDRGAEGEVRQLKMELEEVKQMLMKQEAMAAEARTTASMAQQELAHWRQRASELEPERTRANHMADKLRAELEWRGRVQGQEERRLRTHAQHAEEGRRRVEAQLAYVAMEIQRGQVDIAEGKLTPETIIKKIEVLVNEEAQRVKMHRNADAYMSTDMGVAHPMFAHHAVAPPLFPNAPPHHGWGGGGGGRGFGPGGGGGGGRPAGPQKGLPWQAFDVELGRGGGGNDVRLPAIAPGGGRSSGSGGGGGSGGTDGESPLKKRQIKQPHGGGRAGR